MGNLKKLAGQTVFYGGSNVLSRLVIYLLVPIQTTIFAPKEYGVVGEMYAYVAFLIVILTFGMETAFFRFYDKKSENNDSVYGTALKSLVFCAIVFVLLINIFAKPIAVHIRYPDHSEYIVWFSFLIAIDAVTTIPFAKLRALNRPKLFAMLKMLNVGSCFLFNIIFLYLFPYMQNHGILTAFLPLVYNPAVGVGYIFIANLISSALTLLSLYIVLPHKHIPFDRVLWKKMMAYALPLLIFGLAGNINETFDRILLKWLSPIDIASTQVGIYSACYKISIFMTIVVQGFKYAAEPFFFAHAKESDSRDIYADVMKYFVIVCSLIFLAVMLYINIVKYMVGSKYWSGLQVVPILLLANMFLGIFYNLSIWYKLTDNTRFGAILSIFGAIVTLALNFTLIPILGYMGSAWATFTCYGAMMVASYIIGQKYYKVPYQLTRILMYMGLSVALWGISLLIPIQNQWIRVLPDTLLLGIYLYIVVKKEPVFQSLLGKKAKTIS
ncbi:lipopolysaccharide biosynthesis protein [Parabacteroides sp. FAFU027]|uniref:lipopolysaccharide biosynthesis protein n=1 Tax=Parabacteroides sp. FAFU027 TaxID=2922715 RepID=UPI001FAE8DAC|nr:oligosaccharide flippase family protein [Parabacteroides sp. FAFU027]